MRVGLEANSGEPQHVQHLFKSKQQDPQRGGPSELAQLLLLLMAREGKLDMEEP
jgi:hypothetical protein